MHAGKEYQTWASEFASHWKKDPTHLRLEEKQQKTGLEATFQDIFALIKEGTCESHGLAGLASEEQCGRAGKELNITWKVVAPYEARSKSAPAGCWYSAPNEDKTDKVDPHEGQLLFNFAWGSDERDGPPASKDRQLVCRSIALTPAWARTAFQPLLSQRKTLKQVDFTHEHIFWRSSQPDIWWSDFLFDASSVVRDSTGFRTQDLKRLLPTPEWPSDQPLVMVTLTYRFEAEYSTAVKWFHSLLTIGGLAALILFGSWATTYGEDTVKFVEHQVEDVVENVDHAMEHKLSELEHQISGQFEGHAPEHHDHKDATDESKDDSANDDALAARPPPDFSGEN